jgi:putative GTP pyrophosphokinase
MRTDSDLSRAAVDQLGDRLRVEVTEGDLRLLDQYRRIFRSGYDHVVSVLRSDMGIDVSGRPAKSTTAIVDKLKRGSMRLTQMQDIAGCRLVVADIVEQNRVVSSIAERLAVVISDRRVQSSHGYRAVHVIVRRGGLPIEVQIRTRLQHLWAEMSEKFADEFGIEVKYGAGNPVVHQKLMAVSNQVARLESMEGMLEQLVHRGLEVGSELTTELAELRRDMQTDLASLLASVRRPK